MSQNTKYVQQQQTKTSQYEGSKNDKLMSQNTKYVHQQQTNKS